MNDSDSIVCKPTPWFLFRALVMLAMFSIFAFLFYKDGSSGYRKANEVYYLFKTFDQATKDFAEQNKSETLTPEDWKKYAATQIVAFPKDTSLLPADLKLPMPWPEILQDHERVKPLNMNKLWQDYSKVRKLPAKAPEHPYDAGKIFEQWVVFWVCATLAAGAAFFLIRTIGRSISVNSTGITNQQGKMIPYADLKTLDLRKWETKGLAFLNYDGTSGKGKIRIDGLTYGGFKSENGQPAEELMKHLRANFSGEIIEYAEIPASSAPAAPDAENA